MRLCLFCDHAVENEHASNTLLSYYVCDECWEEMQKGYTLLSCSEEPVFKNQEPICYLRSKDGTTTAAYPTGEWAVYGKEAIEELFAAEQAAQIIENKIGFVIPEVFSEIREIYKNLIIPSKETIQVNEELQNLTNDSESGDTACK